MLHRSFESRHFVTFAAISFFLFALSSATITLGDVQYTLTNIGKLLPAQSVSMAINGRGLVVGTCNDSNHSFTFDGVSAVDLGGMGGIIARAAAVNGSDQIVGAYRPTANSDYRAFRRTGSSMLDLGTIGGTFASATGINNLGQVVGRSTAADGSTRGFFYDGTQMIDLGLMGGGVGAASGTNAINDSSQIVGSYTDSLTHGVLIDGNTRRALGTLGGLQSDPLDINNHGVAVGWATNAAEYRIPAIFDGSNVINIGNLGADINGHPDGLASAINDSGVVVGSSIGKFFTYRAFIYANGKLQDLNDLISPTSGLILISASDINNAGQIVGWAQDAQGLQNAYLLTPVPEPTAAGALSVLLLISRRRR